MKKPCAGSSSALTVVLALASVLALIGTGANLAADQKRWTDADLVAGYRELLSAGGLKAAVGSPVLPSEDPRPAFLDGLAWFAAGTPATAGTLTAARLDEFIDGQVDSYLRLLKSKVEDGADNDYSRTRTWKVIQKMTILREEMAAHGDRHDYPAISLAPGGDDPWENEHTLESPEEFAEKVCRASHERPVLVKFGNTNCTQCMLFEMTGSVKEFAEQPAHRDSVDVYKVWWGFRPDDSFAGKVRDPERLDDLVRAEGVKSSPSFIVYRNGRGYPCPDAYPDGRGRDDRLESCLRQDFAGGASAGTCAATAVSPAAR